MNGRSVGIGAALVLALATATHAEDPDYLHEGPYLQLNGGIQVLTDNGNVQAQLSGKFGVDIIDHVALEAQFEGSRDDDRMVITFQQRSRILTGRWQPFVMYGVGVGQVFGRTGVALRFGGGLDYMLTQNLSIGLDTSYVVITNRIQDYASFGLGVRYGW